MQIPFVCVAFDFMSTEMLDTFPFSMAGAWCLDTIKLKNQPGFNDIYVFIFPIFSPPCPPLFCYGLPPLSTFLSTEGSVESL